MGGVGDIVVYPATTESTDGTYRAYVALFWHKRPHLKVTLRSATQCACAMAMSPVGTVWRAFNVLTTKFQKLRFDCRETKVERSNLSAKLPEKRSGKVGT